MALPPLHRYFVLRTLSSALLEDRFEHYPHPEAQSGYRVVS